MPASYQRLPNQSLAESFELPEQRYLGNAGQAAAAPAAGYQPTLPLAPPSKDLAQVEGLTDAYYDTWGKLQALSQGMNKDYGIDVTKPDFTQPGGGLPFQTFQKLSGAVMSVSNQLGNRLKEQQQAAPYKHTGQVTGTGEEGDPYVSTHLVPELKTAVDRAQDDFYTSGDARRAYDANIKPIEDELRAKAASGDPFWVRQLKVAEKLRTTYATHPSYFRNEFDEQKKKLKDAAGATREIGIARKLTAEKSGFWDPGSYEVKHEDGETFAYKQAEQNLKAGTYLDDEGKTKTLVVDGWKRTPDGKTFLIFKGEQGEDVPTEPLRVDNMTGDQLTAVLQQHNPRLGQTPTLYQAMDILGHATETGGLDEKSLFEAYAPGSYGKLEGARGALNNALTSRHTTEVKKDVVREELAKMNGIFGMGVGNLIQKKMPDGTTVAIRKHKVGDGYFIVGLDDKAHLTKEEVVQYLTDRGIFGEGVVTPDPAALKAQELIQKYSK